eukprot:2793592-Amphidinium_carterae.1
MARHEVAWNDSHKYGVRTKYLRFECTARLDKDGKEEAREAFRSESVVSLSYSEYDQNRWSHSTRIIIIACLLVSLFLDT